MTPPVSDVACTLPLSIVPPLIPRTIGCQVAPRSTVFHAPARPETMIVFPLASHGSIAMADAVNDGVVGFGPVSNSHHPSEVPIMERWGAPTIHCQEV